MKKSYQVFEKTESRKMAEWLAKDGQLLLPMLELVERGVDPSQKYLFVKALPKTRQPGARIKVCLFEPRKKRWTMKASGKRSVKLNT